MLPYAFGFDVRLDRTLRLVTVTLTGIPTPEDAGCVAESVRAEILTLGPDAGRHRTLYDVRGVQVLPQATTDFVIRHFADADGSTQWARRMALVASTALTRRQIRRVAEIRPDAAVFDAIDAARAWLLESD